MRVITSINFVNERPQIPIPFDCVLFLLRRHSLAASPLFLFRLLFFLLSSEFPTQQFWNFFRFRDLGERWRADAFVLKKKNKRKTPKKKTAARENRFSFSHTTPSFLNFFLLFLTVSIFCSVLSQLQRRFLVFFSFIFDTFLLMTLQIKNSLWRMKRFAIRLRDGPSLIFTLVFVLTRFSSSYNWWSGDFHRLNLVLPG